MKREVFFINLVTAGKNKFKISRQGKMQTECHLYLTPALAEKLEQDCIQQLVAAASLPGLVGPVLAMPDVHTGFGLPIGGIMAMDGTEGLVSAGAVGMDINCGVRLLQTSIDYKELTDKQLKQIMKNILDRVPVGLGKARPYKGAMASINKKIFRKGARALVEAGYGRWDDLDNTEEKGAFSLADPRALSKKALSRSDQLGTLGSGNHFIELGYVEQVFNSQAAGKMNLQQGKLTILIHTGSRGFGHQICTDFSSSMVQDAARYKIDLPNKGLAAVPIESPEGQKYLQAMGCAVNFAFANRQLIAHLVREAVGEALHEVPHRLGLNQVYDVAHNIAKFEEHKKKRVLIHRKGATRALPPDDPLNPPAYKKTGQPAIIPGSMGTGSYVTIARKKAAETYFSVNHGAGRVLSRSQAKKQISKNDFDRQMGDVQYNIRDYRKIVDEAPGAYKDIDDVINTLADIDITEKVCRLKPLATIKG